MPVMGQATGAISIKYMPHIYRSSWPVVCAVAMRQHQIAYFNARIDRGSIMIDALVAKEIHPVLFGIANRFIRADNFFQCEDDALARMDQFFASTPIRGILGVRFMQRHVGSYIDGINLRNGTNQQLYKR